MTTATSSTVLATIQPAFTSKKRAMSGRAHGVGVITMGNPRAWDTWNELEEARRVEPDPERLDEFINVQLSQDAHDRIARALH
jgi:hypothetical protein